VSGREGLEKFDAGNFDLVVTDLAMDEMNGAQLAAAIKEKPAACPVILLTGFADTLLARDHKPTGIDAILRKPLLPKDLWKAMAQVMAPADPS
jgi:CheY-like chemotaxis protein